MNIAKKRKSKAMKQPKDTTDTKYVCQKCKKELSGDNKFCPNCGTPKTETTEAVKKPKNKRAEKRDAKKS